MTLGTPLVDQARSYRSVAARVVAALPANPGCVVQRNVGDGPRALFDYFERLRFEREDSPKADGCRALLVQGVPGRMPDPGLDWQPLWQGGRPGERNEVFGLYVRAPGTRSSTSSTQ
jgi:hypothetical protein